MSIAVSSTTELESTTNQHLSASAQNRANNARSNEKDSKSKSRYFHSDGNFGNGLWESGPMVLVEFHWAEFQLFASLQLVGVFFQRCLCNTNSITNDSNLYFNASPDSASNLYVTGIGEQVSPEFGPFLYTPSPTPSDNFKHALAGGLSGCAISVTLQPLDVIKTRMIGTQAKSNKNFMSAFKETVRTDGVRALWSGSVPTILRVLPGGFIYFGGIHAMKTWLTDANLEDAQTWKDHAQNFAIGATARTIAGTVTCPILVVKTRFEFAAQDETLRARSTFGTLKHIYAKEGMHGLFKGLTPTIARDVPYAGLFLVFYSQVKHMMLQASPQLQEHDSWVTLPAGGIAGGLATFITHPFDVVRTRMQLNSKANGVASTFVYLLRNEGPTSLLRGVTSRVAKRSASSALSWALYEQVASFFVGQKDKSL